MTDLERYQSEAFQEFERNLPPKWFKLLRERSGPLYPFIQGIAYALADARISVESAREMALASTSAGWWLSLHLHSLGLSRRANETDEQALKRYQLEFSHSRNTREGLLALLAVYSGLEPPNVRLETDFQDGLYGQLRVVINTPGNLAGTDFAWVAPFLERYVANGIIPQVDLSAGADPETPDAPGKLACLQSLPFKPFTHRTRFFGAAAGYLGPIWERRAFISPLRLSTARNQVALLSEPEWQTEQPRLIALHQSLLASRQPGERFHYFADNCKYLEVAYQPPNLDTEALRFRRRGFRADGFRFDDVFPRQGNMSRFDTYTDIIDIQGSAPSTFGRDITLPNYELPASYTQPARTAWRVSTHTLPIAIAWPDLWQWTIAHTLFGQWRPFYYPGAFQETTVTESRPVPDVATLPVGLPVPPISRSISFFRLHGNYGQNTNFNELSTVGYTQPSRINWHLPESFSELSSYNFLDSGRSGQVADFYRFGYYPFASTPDALRTHEYTVEQSPLATYLPNVRAGFTRRRVWAFLEVIASIDASIEVDELALMGRAPWRLRIRVDGQDVWLDYPNGEWWTDANGNGRFLSPRADVNDVAYLGLEFLLPQSDRDRRITELELVIGYSQPPEIVQEGWTLPNASQFSLDADFDLDGHETITEGNIERLPVLRTVDFRFVDFTVQRGTNFGALYRINTVLGEDINVIRYNAFRAGESRAGDMLRDRDYSVVTVGG